MNLVSSLCRRAVRPDVLGSMRGLFVRHIAPAPAATAQPALHPRHYFTARPGLQAFEHIKRVTCRPPALERHYCDSPHGAASNRARRFALATVPLIGIGVVGGAVFAADTIYIETVPFTNRTHFVFRSPQQEREHAESTFTYLKNKYASIIFDQHHPDSVRVNNIASKLVRGVHRSLITKSHAGSVQPMTSHLDGINWEVVIVNDKDQVAVWSLPAGKILIPTAMLDRLNTDDDIAGLIAHEIGHMVARHWAEKFVYWWLPTPLRVPVFQRAETEADRIGMMLLGAAGFDPHIAPATLAKLELEVEDNDRPLLCTHPSNKKRIQLLSQADLMEEALKLYRDVSPGQDTDKGSL